MAFENMSFNYPDGRKVLEHITFTICPQEKIAIVGRNRFGKTTLIKLLCRLYAPIGENSYLKGSPLSSYALQMLRKSIAPSRLWAS